MLSCWPCRVWCLAPWLQSGCTPLLVACREGHARVVDALLVAGAALDRRDASGASALHAACAAGHADVVNVLLDSNAMPDAAVRHCTSRRIGDTHPRILQLHCYRPVLDACMRHC